MNPSKVRMIEDNDNHYVMHDGNSAFKVPKAGLSEAMHGKIRKMADGGEVSKEPEVNASFAPPQASFQPADALPPRIGANVGTPSYAEFGGAGSLPPGAFNSGAGGGGGGGGGTGGYKPDVGIGGSGGVGGSASSPAPTTAIKEEGGATEKKINARSEPGAKKEEAAKPPPKKGPGAPRQQDAQPDSDAMKALKEKMLFKEAEMGATAELQQKAIDHMAILDNENKRNAINAHQQGQALINKHQAAVDEMSKINTTIDPDRYWASRSTPQKILSILGVALGGINGGPNQGLELIQNAINRDVEAQKEEHQIRLARGKAVAEGYQTDYSLAHSMAGDDLAANELAKSSANARAKALVDQTITKFGGYQARPDLVLLSNELAQKQAAAAANAEHIKSETALNYSRARKLNETRATGVDTSGAEKQIDNYFNTMTEHGFGKETDTAKPAAVMSIARQAGLPRGMTDEVNKMLPDAGRWKLLNDEERTRIINNAKRFVRANAGKPGAGGVSTDDLDIEER